MSTVEKSGRGGTIEKSRVHLTRNLVRFYRVPFKSLLRVQIKWARVYRMVVKNWYSKVGLLKGHVLGALKEMTRPAACTK